MSSVVSTGLFAGALLCVNSVCSVSSWSVQLASVSVCSLPSVLPEHLAFVISPTSCSELLHRTYPSAQLVRAALFPCLSVCPPTSHFLSGSWERPLEGVIHFLPPLKKIKINISFVNLLLFPLLTLIFLVLQWPLVGMFSYCTIWKYITPLCLNSLFLLSFIVLIFLLLFFADSQSGSTPQYNLWVG